MIVQNVDARSLVFPEPEVVYVREREPTSEFRGSVAGQILLGLLFGGALIGLIYVFFIAAEGGITTAKWQCLCSRPKLTYRLSSPKHD